jgi:hypothetical protein
MAEDKEEQNKRTEGQSDDAPWSQTSAGSTEEPNQGQRPPEESSNADPEQTGEGTGAKAGEYS